MDAKLRSSSTKVCKKDSRRNGGAKSSSMSSTTTSSLMSILRPKVYITDTSSFKSLVQELTGRSNYDDPFPPPAVATSASSCIPNLSESQDYADHVEGSSSEVTGHFFSACYDDSAVGGGGEDNAVVVGGGAGEGCYGDVMHDGMDLLTYRLLESWLMDTNHRGNDQVVMN
ncbi:hypothetical protein LINGRAPRIM_LOCUS1658 [Linum grandiflorum]